MGKKYQGVLTEKEEFLYPDSVSETLPESIRVVMPKNGKQGIQLLLDTTGDEIQMDFEGDGFYAEWYETVSYTHLDVYKRQLYAEEAVEVPKLITAFLQKLHTPEERSDAAKWMEKMLKELEKEKQMDVLKLQTICIRIVIEVNGYLKEIGMEESSLHDRLNEALKQLLLCAEGQEVDVYKRQVCKDTSRNDFSEGVSIYFGRSRDRSCDPQLDSGTMD